jgi:hypothetical protein
MDNNLNKHLYRNVHAATYNIATNEIQLAYTYKLKEGPNWAVSWVARNTV